MKRKSWPLLALTGIVIVIGGVSLFKEGSVLCLENVDHPRVIRVWIRSPEPFSIFYIHSIYKEPVIETFQIEGNVIALKGVKTRSPAVMEYYGFEEMKEFHPMDQKLGVLYFKWGVGEGQEVMIRGRKISLREIGTRGDRIQLRVESISLWKYLFSRVTG